MAINPSTQISKDTQSRTLKIVRAFNAKPDLVWRAWTESGLLDQWWAPKPWKSETKTFQFSEGGHWLYAMKGPNGETSWSIVEFHSIKKPERFDSTSSFCDENGNKNSEFPTLLWKTRFIPDGDHTRMEIEIYCDKEADFKKIIEMGFEGGFSMALVNLDELLAR